MEYVKDILGLDIADLGLLGFWESEIRKFLGIILWE
jgi:hypothetical protein